MKKPPPSSETDEQRRERITRERIQAATSRIMERIDHRGDFLKERFPNMRHESGTADCRRFIFEPSPPQSKSGVLEFTLSPTDTHEALFFQITILVTGTRSRKSDYITLPLSNVNIAKANAFIESAILEFASLYTQ